MTQKILGVDIGTHSVKLLLLERSFDDFRILRFVEQPLNPQTRLPHEELAKLALEQSMQNQDFQADIISASYPGHLLSSRVIDLPFTNAKKISQVIEFELEGFVPFQIEDMVFDFHIIEKNENTSKIVCAYMQQERFVKYLDNLACIDPKYFGADITDLPAIAHVALVPQDQHYAICDIGHSKTNVCIMHGKELQYTRTIGIGGLHFTRAVQRAFNVNFEKAESLKLARGKLYVREEDTDQISRILAHVATELVSGIKQTFLGFDNAFGEHHPIAALYCTGGSSRLGGLLDYFSFHLRANVLELDTLGVTINGRDDLDGDGKTMTQALANALKPMFSNRLPKINFRKGPYAYKQDIQLLTNELKSVGVLLSVIFLLGIGYYFYTGHFYAKKAAAIDRKIAKIVKDEMPELDAGKKRGNRQPELNAYLKKAESKFKELESQVSAIAGGGASVLDVMQEISSRLPPKKDVRFEISEFSYSDDFVRLNARTNDPLNVSKITTTLKESELFSQIEATDPQAKPGNLWDFTMKIDFKGAAEK